MTAGNRCLLVAFGAMVLTGLGHAAVDCPARENELPHVCAADGTTVCIPEYPLDPGPICSDTRPAAICPDNECVIDFVTGPRTTFRGVLTLSLDDSVEEMVRFPSGSNVIAVALSLDLGKKGVITQIHQNISSPTSEPAEYFGVPLSESLLVSLGDIDVDTGKAKAVNDLAYRGLDDEMGTALRAVFGVTGNPVLTKIGSVLITDQGTTGLGTVVRMKVKGGFFP